MADANDKFEISSPREVDVADLRTETRHVGPFPTFVHPPDPTAGERMKIIEASGTLAFWDDDGEDIYTENDGDAV